MTEITEIEKFRRELAVRDLDKTYDLSTDLVKWLGATIFALNGAAMIALLNSAELRRLLIDGPGVIFAIGVILPIVGTIIVVQSLAKLGDVLGKALWKGDNLDVGNIDSFTPDFDGSLPSKIAMWLFILSIACFIIGCFWGSCLLANDNAPQKSAKIEVKK